MNTKDNKNIIMVLKGEQRDDDSDCTRGVLKVRGCGQERHKDSQRETAKALYGRMRASLLFYRKL